MKHVTGLPRYLFLAAVLWCPVAFGAMVISRLAGSRYAEEMFIYSLFVACGLVLIIFTLYAEEEEAMLNRSDIPVEVDVNQDKWRWKMVPRGFVHSDVSKICDLIEAGEHVQARDKAIEVLDELEDETSLYGQ